MTARRTNGRASRAVSTAALAGLIIAMLALGACTSINTVHVPRSTARSGDAGVHVVQRGDTLYKIAWQHRVDQRDLARWNGIRNPDLIHAGQRLRLSPPAGRAAAAARNQDARPQRAETRPAAASRAPATRAPAAPPRSAAAAEPPPAWSWPTEGNVVTAFGSRDGIASGVGIGGREGQPVRAAAAGRVVYAGSGLIGYGQLVILKHNDTYLSAYGHNGRLLVTQGEDVQRGATIASMGLGPERRPRLHFEIRRNGVPVDPLLFFAR